MNPHGAKYHIAVCDDTATDRACITQMTREIMSHHGISCDIAVFDSGSELLTAIQKGSVFDILLLDVIMDKIDGLALAAELRKQGQRSAIVFISSNRELAMYGYEVSAVRYLAKPVDADKLSEALQCCFSRMQAKKEILLPTEHGYNRISISDIQFVDAFDRGSRFFMTDHVLITRMKLSEAQSILPASLFLPCHRAFIVNLSQVATIRKYDFVMASGKLVPISRDRYPEIYKTFVHYIND